MNGYGQRVRLAHVMYCNIALLSTKSSFLREVAHPGWHWLRMVTVETEVKEQEKNMETKMGTEQGRNTELQGSRSWSQSSVFSSPDSS